MNLALALIALVAAASPARADSAYSFSPTAVEGSARAVGIGGATVASPKDYSAVFVNPAGLGGLAGDGVDFGSDSNNIDNFVVDTTNSKSKALNDPLKFSFFGFRYVTTNGWGFGFATQTPYELDDTFSGTAKVPKGQKGQSGQDQTEIKAQTQIYTIAAAKSFLDQRLSVGLAANYIYVNESYDFQPVFTTTAPIHQYVANDAFSADVGLLGAPWPWLDVGAAYKMGWRVPFDSARNGAAIGTAGRVSAFRDAKVPDKVAVGLRWHPNRYISALVQGNYSFAMRDTVVVGSGLFPGGTGVLTIGQKNIVDGHWGLEFVPVDENDLTFKVWAGGYLEDTGLQGGFTRYHRTAGFSLSPWAINLSMAIDDTNLYNNFTVGLGVDMLETAQRVCKRFGCSLPL